MKIRLTVFVAAVLLLPPLALFLSEQEWPQENMLDGAIALPAFLSGIALLAFAFLLDSLSLRSSGTSLLRTQRNYALWLGTSGAMLGAMLGCLNVFSPLWLSPLSRPAGILSAGIFGSLLLPAVLVTRLWLSALPALLRKLTRTFALPALQPESAAMLLLLASLTGLLGGTVWPLQLAWLLWLSPLLLLIALQLLWHESSVFSGLKNGDWSRVVLGAASGILVSGGTLAIYRLAGGALYLTVPAWLFTLLLGACGLLCLQLGDVIAENWRGKKRTGLSKKKPFPIPVVAMKD